MTPERLDDMVRRTEATGWHTDDVAALAAEIRRLWAERDARQLAGRPVSEDWLAGIREADARIKKFAVGEETDWNDSVRGCLLEHVAFLERLLADADDLPRVRATGYADGWRAGVEAAAELVEGAGLLSNLARRIRELAGEGSQ